MTSFIALGPLLLYPSDPQCIYTPSKLQLLHGFYEIIEDRALNLRDLDKYLLTELNWLCQRG